MSRSGIPYLKEKGTLSATWPIARRIGILTQSKLRKAHRIFRHLPPHEVRTILDIGAHSGEFTDHALDYFNPTSIWLLEASPEMADHLRNKYRDQKVCHVVENAISDHSGTATFHLSRHAPSSSLLKPIGHANEVFQKDLSEVREVEVKTISLDDFVESQSIEEVDLLKADIQGGERLLLLGGKKALQKVRTLHLEVWFERCYEDCPLFCEIHPLLVDLGFKLFGLEELRRGSLGSIAYANAVYTRLP